MCALTISDGIRVDGSGGVEASGGDAVRAAGKQFQALLGVLCTNKREKKRPRENKKNSERLQTDACSQHPLLPSPHVDLVPKRVGSVAPCRGKRAIMMECDRVHCVNIIVLSMAPEHSEETAQRVQTHMSARSRNELQRASAEHVKVACVCVADLNAKFFCTSFSCTCVIATLPSTDPTAMPVLSGKMLRQRCWNFKGDSITRKGVWGLLRSYCTRKRADAKQAEM